MADQPVNATALADKAQRYRWQCSCGATKQRIKVDRNGRPFARCAACYRIIFWRDPEKFLSADPFCRHAPVPVPTKKPRIQTSWCGQCQIRIFEPAPPR